MCNATEKHDVEVVKAALTLNIARFTEWPPASNVDDEKLNLCVVGSPATLQAFERLQDKTIRERKANVIYLYRLKNLQICQIIYIDEMPSNVLLQLLRSITNEAILTISSDKHFLKNGGMIKLKQQQGKLKILINLTPVKKASLIISSRLLHLATIVDENTLKLE